MKFLKLFTIFLLILVLLGCNLPATAPAPEHSLDQGTKAIPSAESSTGFPATQEEIGPEATTFSSPVPPSASDLVQPANLTYLGAFRLPGDGERPLTFAYGGSAMTFNPNGDPSGPADGYPGSLFVSGHDRLPYGELPNGWPARSPRSASRRRSSPKISPH